MFKPDVDHTLGLKLRNHIQNRGPFEILEPRSDGSNTSRYDDLSRARAAVLCLGKSGCDWLNQELDSLNRATAIGKFYHVKRAIYLKSASAAENIELFESDHILQSETELDAFLAELQQRQEGAAA